MAVFDDFQQDGAFLGIQQYKKGIVEDEQLTPLYLLQFRLYGVLGLCDLQGLSSFEVFEYSVLMPFLQA